MMAQTSLLLSLSYNTYYQLDIDNMIIFIVSISLPIRNLKQTTRRVEFGLETYKRTLITKYYSIPTAVYGILKRYYKTVRYYILDWYVRGQSLSSFDKFDKGVKR